MDHDLERVVQRNAPSGVNGGLQDPHAGTHAVADATQRVKTPVIGDLVASRLRHVPGGTGNIRLPPALLVRVTDV